MPGYVSHTVLAHDVYNKINKDINIDYMLTFSLGGDLCNFVFSRELLCIAFLCSDISLHYFFLKMRHS